PMTLMRWRAGCRRVTSPYSALARYAVILPPILGLFGVVYTCTAFCDGYKGVYSAVRDQEADLFAERTFTFLDDKGEQVARKYRLFIPAEAESTADNSKQWPLLVWLHGQG